MSTFGVAARRQNGSTYASNVKLVEAKAGEIDFKAELEKAGVSIGEDRGRIKVNFGVSTSHASMAIHRGQLNSVEGVRNVQQEGRGIAVNVASETALDGIIKTVAATALTLNDDFPSDNSVGGILRQAVVSATPDADAKPALEGAAP